MTREPGFMLIIAGVVVSLWLGAAWMTRATPADLIACQNATGWNAARCEAEINR